MFDDNFKLGELPPESFLAWPGSKAKCIGQLVDHFPPAKNYFEPFLGGGTVFLNVAHKYENTFLSDLNAPLINSYRSVRDFPNIVIKNLKKHLECDSKQHFYRVRNNLNYQISKDRGGPELAADFIYLNKRCVGGFWCENKKGEAAITYNSERCGATSCYQPQKIREAARFLRNRKVKISCKNFENVEPTKDAVIYLDPPYHAAGVKYKSDSFKNDLQVKVFDKFKEWSKTNKVLLSNSNTDFIKTLYRDFNIIKIKTTRNENHKKEKNSDMIHAEVTELLIKNF